MVKKCSNCWVIQTPSNSYTYINSQWEEVVRSRCKKCYKIKATKKVAKKANKKVVKEVKAPKIDPKLNEIIKGAVKALDIYISSLKNRVYYRKQATIFVTITAILWAGICILAGLNAFGILPFIK